MLNFLKIQNIPLYKGISYSTLCPKEILRTIQCLYEIRNIFSVCNIFLVLMLSVVKNYLEKCHFFLFVLQSKYKNGTIHTIKTIGKKSVCGL